MTGIDELIGWWPAGHPILLRVAVQVPLFSLVILLLMRFLRPGGAAGEGAQEAGARAMTRREQELTFLADHLPAQIALIDRELRYRFVNQSAAAGLGLTPEQMIGRAVVDVIGEERMRSRVGPMQRALGGAPGGV